MSGGLSIWRGFAIRDGPKKPDVNDGSIQLRQENISDSTLHLDTRNCSKFGKLRDILWHNEDHRPVELPRERCG